MSDLDNRVRAELGLDPDLLSRWARIKEHYERCIKRGMSVNTAAQLAISNLSRSNRHDRLRDRT